MGGERETTLPGGVRLHESAGQVHFHKGDLKVAIPSADFWSGWDYLKTGKSVGYNFTDIKNDSRLALCFKAGDIDVTIASTAQTKGATFQAIDKFVNP